MADRYCVTLIDLATSRVLRVEQIHTCHSKGIRMAIQPTPGDTTKDVTLLFRDHHIDHSTDLFNMSVCSTLNVYAMYSLGYNDEKGHSHPRLGDSLTSESDPAL